jgi:hypothetical protein
MDAEAPASLLFRNYVGGCLRRYAVGFPAVQTRRWLRDQLPEPEGQALARRVGPRAPLRRSG